GARNSTLAPPPSTRSLQSVHSGLTHPYTSPPAPLTYRCLAAKSGRQYHADRELDAVRTAVAATWRHEMGRRDLDCGERSLVERIDGNDDRRAGSGAATE